MRMTIADLNFGLKTDKLSYQLNATFVCKEGKLMAKLRMYKTNILHYSN